MNMNNEEYEYEYPSFYHEFDDEEDERPRINEINFITRLLQEDSTHLITNATIEIVYREEFETSVFGYTRLMIHNKSIFKQFGIENFDDPPRNTTTIQLIHRTDSDTAIPHIKLIADAGSFIRHLYLVDFYKMTSKLKIKKNEKAYLDYIFRHCLLLKSLSIKLSSILECNPSFIHPRKKGSVERLENLSSELDPKVLTDIFVRLPQTAHILLIQIATGERRATNTLFYHTLTGNDFIIISKCYTKFVTKSSDKVQCFVINPSTSARLHISPMTLSIHT